MQSDKGTLTFFKQVELDSFERDYQFNRKDNINIKDYIIRKLQDIKDYLIENYFQTENRIYTEELFDNINYTILQILDTKGENLEKDLILKLINLEWDFINMVIYCKK